MSTALAGSTVGILAKGKASKYSLNSHMKRGLYTTRIVDILTPIGIKAYVNMQHRGLIRIKPLSGSPNSAMKSTMCSPSVPTNGPTPVIASEDR